MSDMENQRLARIEKRIDEMAEALITLARVEERIANAMQQLDHADRVYQAHADRIAALERLVAVRTGTLAMVDRAFWIVLTAGVTFILSFWGK